MNEVNGGGKKKTGENSLEMSRGARLVRLITEARGRRRLYEVVTWTRLFCLTDFLSEHG